MDKKFENYLHETRGEFVKAVNELQWNTAFRTKCENLLIAFDQMKQALRQPHVIGSVCDGCGSKFDAMDISVGVCYCCQKEIKQTDL